MGKNGNFNIMICPMNIDYLMYIRKKSIVCIHILKKLFSPAFHTHCYNLLHLMCKKSLTYIGFYSYIVV